MSFLFIRKRRIFFADWMRRIIKTPATTLNYTLYVCVVVYSSRAVYYNIIYSRERGEEDQQMTGIAKKKKRRHIYNSLCGKVGLQYLYVTGGSVFSSCSRRR